MYITEVFKPTDPLLEAAMNPTSFSAALAAGGDKKVVVGFEFEVCVPFATTKAAEKAGASTITSERYIDDLPTDWYENVGVERDSGDVSLMALFKLKAPVQYDGKTFTTLTALIKYWREWIAKNELIGIIDNNRCRLTDRNLEAVKGFLWTVSGVSPIQKIYRLYSWVQQKDSPYRVSSPWYGLYDALGTTRYNMGEAKFFLRDVVGATTAEKVFSIFDYKISALKRLWQDTVYVDSYDSDYTGAVTALRKPLEDNFGAVTVFNDYHQKTKLPGIWYIEPDGSLSPNGGDSSAEVVTPPLPVGEAVAALKTFYGIAKQLNLYTSADNNTGLHINVSIPETLDVLKLAVFLGDQYILKTFGREENRYVSGVMKELLNTSQGTAPAYTDLIKAQDHLTKFKKLQRMAVHVSDDHTASINFNGTYVSFRHAGGDYLNNYTQVINVVGRFVRAMIIASDPNMYRNEYLSKLTKLFVPKPETDTLDIGMQQIAQAKKSPIPALMFAAGSRSTSISRARIVNGIKRRFPTDGYVQMPNAQAEFIKIMRGVRGLERKQAFIDNASLNGVVFIKVMPIQQELDRISNGNNIATLFSSSYDLLGTVVWKAVQLAPGTPAHTAAVQQMILQYKKSKGIATAQPARRPRTNRRDGNVPDSIG